MLGTRNSKKRQEIVDILGDLSIELADLTRWPDTPEVVEDGSTFEATARKKARELAQALEGVKMSDLDCLFAFDPAFSRGTFGS